MLNINSDKQNLKNVKVGKNVKIFDFVNAYDCKIENKMYISESVIASEIIHDINRKSNRSLIGES